MRSLKPVLVLALAGGTLNCTGVSQIDNTETADGGWPRAPMMSWNSDIAVSVELDRTDQGRWLTATGVLRNVGERRLTGQITGNALRFRVYTDPARTGDPVWRSEQGVETYSLALTDLGLIPGGEYEFGSAIALIDDVIVGQTPRTYYVALAIRFVEPEFQTREFPAGEIVLP